MYGQNSGVRPDAPGQPIFTKFCTRVRVPGVFLSFEFQEDREKKCWICGDRNFVSPIEKAHRLYNSLLLPHKLWLCYSQSKDGQDAGAIVSAAAAAAAAAAGSDNSSYVTSQLSYSDIVQGLQEDAEWSGGVCVGDGKRDDVILN